MSVRRRAHEGESATRGWIVGGDEDEGESEKWNGGPGRGAFVSGGKGSNVRSTLTRKEGQAYMDPLQPFTGSQIPSPSLPLLGSLPRSFPPSSIPLRDDGCSGHLDAVFPDLSPLAGRRTRKLREGGGEAGM